MKFVITGYDGKDEGALDRRMSVRAEHLEGIRRQCELGHVICAGGITNEQGNLAGSFLVMDFESRAELDAYLQAEPYVINNVWEDVKIDTCNLAVLDNEMVGK